MSGASFIRAIPQSLPKRPKVGAPGVPAAFDPSRGKTGVQHRLRIKPIDTRVYSKKTTPTDPNEFANASFYVE